MKILLLTDMPPCRGWTAGLVLDQLCRFLPSGSIGCFTVNGPLGKIAMSDDLDWIPFAAAEGPSQRAPHPSVRFQRWRSLKMDITNAAFHVPKLVDRAAAFGKEIGADLVYATLEGQTMIRMALPLARRLDVPLISHIYDPPQWWLRDNWIDGISTRRVLRCFRETLQQSACCAAASWSMAEAYRRGYDARAIPLIPSLDVNLAHAPATEPHAGKQFIIGVAGQIYAAAEWQALIAALDRLDWKLRGREVTIRLLGRKTALETSGSQRIEFLGWRPQAEAIDLLSEADVLYCPYWFDPVFDSEARLSFPSKLTSYLAAGRPVLSHAPSYASTTRFLNQHEAGLCCHSLEPDALIDSLMTLADDQTLYAKLAGNGSRAFRENLTLSCYRESFRQVLGVADGFLLPLPQVRSIAA